MFIFYEDATGQQIRISDLTSNPSIDRIRITSIGTGVSLFYNGVAVTLNTTLDLSGTNRLVLNLAENFDAITGFNYVLVNAIGSVVSTQEERFEIHVMPVNDAPILTKENLYINADTSANQFVLTQAHLEATDVDVADTAEHITYTVKTLPAGALEVQNADDESWVALAEDGTFTQADINAGRVRYVPDAERSTTSFTFTVDDGNEDNSAPVVETFYIDNYRQPVYATGASNDITLTRSSVVETGYGADTIRGSTGDDYIDAGLDADIIELEPSSGSSQAGGAIVSGESSSSGGADEVVYEVAIEDDGYVARGGSDVIRGFKPGEDTLTFRTTTPTADGVDPLDDFLNGVNDKFHVRPEVDSTGVTGLMFLFPESILLLDGRLSDPLLFLYFDKPYSVDDFKTLLLSEGETDISDIENLDINPLTFDITTPRALKAIFAGPNAVPVAAGLGIEIGTETAIPEEFTVKVVDGLVENAKVYVDSNYNGVIDEESDHFIGTTDATGTVAGMVAAHYAGHRFLADLSEAADIYTGERFTSTINYKATAPDQANSSDGVVLSPLTTAVIDLIDAGKTETQALDLIFGAGSGIVLADLYEADNYIPPASTPDATDTLGNKKLKIAQTSIQLHLLYEEMATVPELVARLSDGFDAAQDLSPENQMEAMQRLTASMERADGRPVALPGATGASGTEDTVTAIDVDDWGFRDPVSDVSGQAGSLASVRVVSVTGVGLTTWRLENAADGSLIYDSTGAGSATISAAALEDLQLITQANYAGDVIIRYVLIDNDGTASDESELVVMIEPVNDAPSVPMGPAEISVSDITYGADTPSLGTYSAISVDGDTLTYSISGGDARFTIDANTGVLRVVDGATFDPDTETTISLSIIATDGTENSAPLVVTVSVIDDLPPLGEAIITRSDYTLSVNTDNIEDPEDVAITPGARPSFSYQWYQAGVNGAPDEAIAGETGRTFTAGKASLLADSIRFEALTPGIVGNVFSVTIAQADTDDVTVSAPDENGVRVIHIETTANDVNHIINLVNTNAQSNTHIVALRASTGGAGITLAGNDVVVSLGQLSGGQGAEELAAAGTRYYVAVTATDLNGASATINSAPYAFTDTEADIFVSLAHAGMTLSAMVTASDSDQTTGDIAIGYQWYLVETDGTHTLLTGATAADYTPSSFGDYFVRITSTDSAGGRTVVDSTTYTLLEVNDAPVISSVSIEDSGSVLMVTAIASDMQNDPIIYSYEWHYDDGTTDVVVGANSRIYTPPAVAASANVHGLVFTADATGTAGNSITFDVHATLTNGADAVGEVRDTDSFLFTVRVAADATLQEIVTALASDTVLSDAGVGVVLASGADGTATPFSATGNGASRHQLTGGAERAPGDYYVVATAKDPKYAESAEFSSDPVTIAAPNTNLIPRVLGDRQTTTINENVMEAVDVYTFTAFDVDDATFGVSELSLDDNRFAVVEGSAPREYKVQKKAGVVLNHEEADSFEITITATDKADNTITATQRITINVGDVEESGMVVSTEEASLVAGLAVGAIPGQQFNHRFDLTALFVDEDEGDIITNYQMVGVNGAALPEDFWLKFDASTPTAARLLGTPLAVDSSGSQGTTHRFKLVATDADGVVVQTSDLSIVAREILDDDDPYNDGSPLSSTIALTVTEENGVLTATSTAVDYDNDLDNDGVFESSSVFSYQWYSGTRQDNPRTPVEGAIGDTYTPGKAIFALHGLVFTAKDIGVAGNNLAIQFVAVADAALQGVANGGTSASDGIITINVAATTTLADIRDAINNAPATTNGVAQNAYRIEASLASDRSGSETPFQYIPEIGGVHNLQYGEDDPFGNYFVVVTALDSRGGLTSALLPNSIFVGADTASPTGTVSLTETAGGVLNIDTSRIVDNRDGNADLTLTYQWYRVVTGSTDEALTGETNATYTRPAESGDDFYAIVTATDTTGNVGTFTAANNRPSGAVSIDGDSFGTWVVNVSGVSDAEGSDLAFTYQWYRVVGDTTTLIDGAVHNVYGLGLAARTIQGIEFTATESGIAGNNIRIDIVRGRVDTVSVRDDNGITVIEIAYGGGATTLAHLASLVNGDAEASALVRAFAPPHIPYTDFALAAAQRMLIGGQTLESISDPDTSYYAVVTATDESGFSRSFTSNSETLTDTEATGNVVVTRAGDTLTASVSDLADADHQAGAIDVRFQWYSGAPSDSSRTPIAGETGASYTPESSGSYYVVATTTDSRGGQTDLASTADSSFSAFAATGSVSLMRTIASDRLTLTAVNNGISDADNTDGTPPRLTYEWHRVTPDGTDTIIEGIESSSYTLPNEGAAASVVFHGLKFTATTPGTEGNGLVVGIYGLNINDPYYPVRVWDDASLLNGWGFDVGFNITEETTLQQMKALFDAAADFFPDITVEIAEDGEGNTLAGTTRWSDVFETNSGRNFSGLIHNPDSTRLSGGTKYPDGGYYVVVTATDVLGDTTQFTSETEIVNDNPTQGSVRITSPAIANNEAVEVGEVLTADTSALTDIDDSTLDFTYQWLKDGVAIFGATSKTYTPSVFGTYQVVVTASDSVTSVETEFTSGDVEIAFVNTPPSGNVAIVKDDYTLSVRKDGISDDATPTDDLTFTYQWYNGDPASGGTAITNAVGKDYIVGAASLSIYGMVLSAIAPGTAGNRLQINIASAGGSNAQIITASEGDILPGANRVFNIFWREGSTIQEVIDFINNSPATSRYLRAILDTQDPNRSADDAFSATNPRIPLSDAFLQGGVDTNSIDSSQNYYVVVKATDAHGDTTTFSAGGTTISDQEASAQVSLVVDSIAGSLYAQVGTITDPDGTATAIGAQWYRVVEGGSGVLVAETDTLTYVPEIAGSYYAVVKTRDAQGGITYLPATQSRTIDDREATGDVTISSEISATTGKMILTAHLSNYNDADDDATPDAIGYQWYLGHPNDNPRIPQTHAQGDSFTLPSVLDHIILHGMVFQTKSDVFHDIQFKFVAVDAETGRGFDEVATTDTFFVYNYVPGMTRLSDVVSDYDYRQDLSYSSGNGGIDISVRLASGAGATIIDKVLSDAVYTLSAMVARPGSYYAVITTTDSAGGTTEHVPDTPFVVPERGDRLPQGSLRIAHTETDNDDIAETGETLSADTSGIIDPDDSTLSFVRYQWFSSTADGVDTPILGAVGATYTPNHAGRYKVYATVEDSVNNVVTVLPLSHEVVVSGISITAPRLTLDTPSTIIPEQIEGVPPVSTDIVNLITARYLAEPNFGVDNLNVNDDRFEIVAGTETNSYTLRLKSGLSFNYEAESFVNLVITATGSNGIISAEAFTINIADVNEPTEIADRTVLAPVIEDIAVDIGYGSAIESRAFDLTALFSDADSRDLTYHLVDSSGGALVEDSWLKLDASDPTAARIYGTFHLSNAGSLTSVRLLALDSEGGYAQTAAFGPRIVEPAGDTEATATVRIVETGSALEAVITDLSDGDHNPNKGDIAVHYQWWGGTHPDTVTLIDGAIGATYEYGKALFTLHGLVLTAKADGVAGNDVSVQFVTVDNVADVGFENGIANSIKLKVHATTTLADIRDIINNDNGIAIKASLVGDRLPSETPFSDIPEIGAFHGLQGGTDTPGGYYFLTLTSIDSEMGITPFSSAVYTLEINDHPPVLSGPDTVSFAEGTYPAGHAVAAYTASDADGTTAFTYTVSGDSRFEIVPSSGHLRVKNGAIFDFATPSDRTIELTVTVSDGARTDEIDLTITVTDVNVPPNFDGTGRALTLNEGTYATGQDLHTYVATDHDGDSLAFFVEGDDRFEIDKNTAVLRVVDGAVFDADGDNADSTISLTITADDGGEGSSRAYAVTVTIVAVDEHAPVFNVEGPVQTAAIGTSSAAGTQTGHYLTVRDIDGVDTPLTFTTNDADFVISSAGVVNDANDNTPEGVYNLVVSNSADLTNGAGTRTIEVSHEGVVVATYTVFVNSKAVVSLDTTSASAVPILPTDYDLGIAVSYTDADDGAVSDLSRAVFSFTLEDSEGNYVPTSILRVDAVTGNIVLTSTDALVAGETYNARLTASDSDSDAHANADEVASEAVDFSFTITSGSPPAFADGGTTLNLDEGTYADGHTLHTYTASDVDGETLTYSVSGDARFTIDRNTGALQVVDGAIFDSDRAANADTLIRLTVSVDDGSSSTVTREVEITINPIDDNPTRFLTVNTAQIFQVLATTGADAASASGNLVGPLVRALDDDGLPNEALSITTDDADFEFVQSGQTPHLYGLHVNPQGDLTGEGGTRTVTASYGDTVIGTYSVFVNAAPVVELSANTASAGVPKGAANHDLGITVSYTDADDATPTDNTDDVGAYQFMLNDGSGTPLAATTILSVVGGKIVLTDTSSLTAGRVYQASITATDDDGARPGGVATSEAVTFSFVVIPPDNSGTASGTGGSGGGSGGSTGSAPEFANVDSRIITLDEGSYASGQTLRTYTATDADGDTLTFALSGDDRFEIDANTGVLRVVDGAVFDSDADSNPDIMIGLTITVNDGNGNTSTQVAIVAINPIDDNPITYTDVSSVQTHQVLATTAAEAAVASDRFVGQIISAADADGLPSAPLTFTTNDADFEFVAHGQQPNQYGLYISENANFTGEGGTRSVEVSRDGSVVGTYSVFINEKPTLTLNRAASPDDVPADATSHPLYIRFTYTDADDATPNDNSDDVAGRYRFFMDDGAGGAFTEAVGRFFFFTDSLYLTDASTLTAGATYNVQMIATDDDASKPGGALDSDAASFSFTVASNVPRPNSAPVFSNPATTISFDEGTYGSGRSLADYVATDADGDRVTYTLADGHDARFTIGRGTGSLWILDGSSFDYETEQTNPITLEIIARDDNDATTSLTVTLTIDNIDDNAPTFDTTSGATQSARLLAAESTAGTATGTYVLVYDDDGLDPASPLTFTTSDDDFVVVNNPARDIHKYELKVADDADLTNGGGARAIDISYDGNVLVTHNIFINARPVVTLSRTTAVSEVEEGTVGVRLGITVDYTDADDTTQSDNSDDVPTSYTFWLNDGSDAPPQNVTGNLIVNSDGEIVLLSSTGFTQGATYTALIAATDNDAAQVGGAQNSEAVAFTFTIATPPANNAPVFVNPTAVATLAEGTYPSEQSITGFGATDTDGDRLTYSVSGDDRIGINANTGLLVVKAGQSFDYETEGDTPISLTVTVSDGNGGSATHALAVTLTDADDYLTYTTTQAQSGQIVVGGGADQFTGQSITGLADEDGLPLTALTFTTDSDDFKFVAIDENAPEGVHHNGYGLFTTQDTLIGGTQTVTVYHHAEHSRVIATYEVFINAKPLLLLNATEASFLVGELATNFVLNIAVVGYTDADDTTPRDNTDDAPASYRFMIDDGYGGAFTATNNFTVNDNGNIVVIDASLLTPGLTYNAQIIAVDDDGNKAGGALESDARPFSFTLTGTAPNATPSFTNPMTYINFDEGTYANGLDLATYAATDPDGDTVTFSLSGDNRFAIDENTGALRVVNGATFDYERASDRTHTLTVQANDGNGNSAVQWVTVGLYNIDDNPLQNAAIRFGQSTQILTTTEGGTRTGQHVTLRDADGFPITPFVFTTDDADFSVSAGGRPSDGIYYLEVSADADFTGEGGYRTVRMMYADVVNTPFRVFINAKPVVELSSAIATSEVPLTSSTHDLGITVSYTDADDTTPGDNSDDSATAYSFLLQNSNGDYVASNQFSVNAAGNIVFTSAGGLVRGTVYNARIIATDDDVNKPYFRAPALQSDAVDFSFTTDRGAEAAPVLADNGGTAISLNEGYYGHGHSVVLHTYTASDANNDALTYALSGDDRFEIDANTGALRPVDGAVFDSDDTANPDISFDLTITVSDGTGRTDTRDVTITITPTDDNWLTYQIESAQTAQVALAGGAGQFTGQSIHSLADLDGLPNEPHTFETNDADFEFVAIDGGYGLRTVRELTTGGTRSVTITHPAEGNREIAVYDVFINAQPVIALSSTSTFAPVPIQPSGYVTEIYVGYADADDATPGDTSDDVAGAYSFTLNSAPTDILSVNADGYIEVTSTTSLDAGRVYLAQIVATDDDGDMAGGALQSEAITFYFSVDRGVEAAPVFTNDGTTISLDEGRYASNTPIFTYTAADANRDGFTFSLVDNTDTRFILDNLTGTLWVSAGAVFDYEDASQRVIELEVRVTDAYGFSTTKNVVINLNNIDDNSPVFDTTTGAAQTTQLTPSTSANAQATGQYLIVSDADGLTHTPLTFTTSDSDFVVNPRGSATGGIYDIVVSAHADFTNDAGTRSVDILHEGVVIGSYDIFVNVAPTLALSTLRAPDRISTEPSAHDLGIRVIYTDADDATPSDSSDDVAASYSFLLNDGRGGSLLPSDILSVNADGKIVITNTSALVENARYYARITANDGDGAGGALQSNSIDFSFNTLLGSAPVLPADGAALTLDEGTYTNGFDLHTYVAADADGDGILYTVSGDDRFTIDLLSGVLRVQEGAVFDYDAPALERTVNLRVVAEDGTGGVDRQDVVVTINGIDDNPYIFHNAGGQRQEVVARPGSLTTGNGFVGFEVLVDDLDGTPTELINFTTNDSDFVFVNSTGSASLPADRYALAISSNADTSGYGGARSVEIRYEGTLVRVANFFIDAQAILELSATTASEVPLLPANHDLGITVSYTDADDATPGDNSDDAASRYQFLLDDGTGTYVETSMLSVVNGNIVLNSPTPLAAAATYNARVIAYDDDSATFGQGEPSDPVDFSFTITRGAEAAPIFSDSNGATLSLDEGTYANGQVLYTYAATDANNDNLTFSLVGNTDTRFAIDAQTGVLRITDGAVFDYETVADRTLSLTIGIDDGHSDIVTQEVTLTINNIDDNAPEFFILGGDQLRPIYTTSGAGATTEQLLFVRDADGLSSTPLTFTSSDPDFAVLPSGNVVDGRYELYVSADADLTNGGGARSVVISYGGSTVATLDVFVNAAPVLALNSATATSDVPSTAINYDLGITVAYTDADDSTPSNSLNDVAASYSFTLDDGAGGLRVATNILAVNAAGNIVITDASGLTAGATYRAQIRATDDDALTPGGALQSALVDFSFTIASETLGAQVGGDSGADWLETTLSEPDSDLTPIANLEFDII